MSAPSQQPSADPVTMLTTMVADLDKRVRKIERALFYAAGAASGGSGAWWLTIVMARH